MRAVTMTSIKNTAPVGVAVQPVPPLVAGPLVLGGLGLELAEGGGTAGGVFSLEDDDDLV